MESQVGQLQVRVEDSVSNMQAQLREMSVSIPEAVTGGGPLTGATLATVQSQLDGLSTDIDRLASRMDDVATDLEYVCSGANVIVCGNGAALETGLTG